MLTLQQLTTEMIEQRGLSLHEPRWLREQRKKAWAYYKISPCGLDQSMKSFDFSHAPCSASAPKSCPKGKAGELILEDGKLVHLTLQKDLASEGVLFSDFKTAVLERADLVEKYFVKKKMESDGLNLLSEALWSNGYFLFIPEKLSIKKPFEITLRRGHLSSSMMLQNLIIADQDAEIYVEETAHSIKAEQEKSIFVSTTTIEAEHGSRVSFHNIRDWEKGIDDFPSFRTHAKRDALIRSVFVFRGAETARVEINADLLEQGAEIEHYGIVLGGNNDRLKISARIQHHAPQTNGFLQLKGGLKGHAYAYFDGQIKIAPCAVKASSRLQEQVMLLSPHARSDALPALHIESSPVQVSHSASVSKADPEEIFYAMSRGLSEDQSTALIMGGFFHDVLRHAENLIWIKKARKIINS